MHHAHAHAQILPFRGIMPRIDPSAWIAPGAVVIGDVEIGAQSSVWYGCVIRGDVAPIRIGAGTNIQDGAVIHVTREIGPTVIGNGITIGHQALLHACTLHDGSFIGMRSVILDFAEVESAGYLAAGAVLTPRKRLPGGELWAGSPAKMLRPITPDERDWIPGSAAHYIRLAGLHRDSLSTEQQGP